MTTPKIIFLDIDGPMVPARAALLPGNGFRRLGWTFDPVAVNILDFLSWADPSVHVVLASHRWGDPRVRPPADNYLDMRTQDFWQVHCENQGMNIRWHEDWITPREMRKGEYVKRTKAEEIRAWLNLHPEVKHFVTMDDDLNGGDFVGSAMRKAFHLVGESYDEGLTWRDFKLMIGYLGLKNFEDKYEEYNQQLLVV